VITYHRRRREHRRLSLLLDVLLTARVSFETSRHQSFWAEIPPAEGSSGNFESRWLRQYFWAPLGEPVTDALSPPAAETLTEIEAEAYTSTPGTMEARSVYQLILMILSVVIAIFLKLTDPNSTALRSGWTWPRVNGRSPFQLRLRRSCRPLKR
jgi:hypothetical protein